MASRPGASVEDAAEGLRTWLEGHRVHSFRPLRVGLERRPDSEGRGAWFFEIVLPDPEPGEDTWPPEVLNEF